MVIGMGVKLVMSMLLIFVVVLFMPIAAKRTCRFNYCYFKGHTTSCSTYYCYADIFCKEGSTIYVKNVKYGTNILSDTIDCGYACSGYVVPYPGYRNEIAQLCNGHQKCSLRQWNTDTYWTLDVTFDCHAVTKSHIAETTSPMTKLNNTKSNFIESESNENNSSDDFPVFAIVASIIAVIFFLAFVFIGVVCIKRKIVNNNNTNSTRSQRNVSRDVLQAEQNIVYEDTNLPCLQHPIVERSEQHYDYAEAHIAAIASNESDYNTLHETSRPLKSDPNYDHIPKQLAPVNETLPSTNEDVYNTLNEKPKPKPDSNYDHIQKQSALVNEPLPNINVDVYNNLKERQKPQADPYYDHIQN